MLITRLKSYLDYISKENNLNENVYIVNYNYSLFVEFICRKYNPDPLYDYSLYFLILDLYKSEKTKGNYFVGIDIFKTKSNYNQYY